MRARFVCKVIILLLASKLVQANASEACDGNLKSGNVKVLKEKVLCLSSGSCIQEVTVQHNDQNIVLTTAKRPWVEAGENVDIVKLEGAHLPLRRHRRGYQSQFYKLARYCESS